MPEGRTVPLPSDAELATLRPDVLAFSTREALFAGTVVVFNLVMEERALPMRLEVLRTEVVDKDRRGYKFVSYVSLEQTNSTDRQIIQLFIKKGRGEPRLTR